MEKSRHQQLQSPIAAFNRFWKVAERVTKTIAFLLVFGTLGFVSIHLLA